MSGDKRPAIIIAYHFFWPDDVVSAQQKADLAVGLADRGWDVTVLTSNRRFKDSTIVVEPEVETWKGVNIIRCHRPPSPQSSNIGRLKNSWRLQRAWLKKLRAMKPTDVFLLGTDPQFSQAMLPSVKRIMPHAKQVVWAFDLYPEVLNSAGGFVNRAAATVIGPLARRWNRYVDLFANLGPCMEKRLQRYGHERSLHQTLVPWALVEPESISEPDPEIRQELFGDAAVGVLYSGSFGHAHEYRSFLDLARRLSDESVSFCFAGRGNKMDELKAAVSSSDKNIRFAGFCSLEDLPKRLLAADFHMISLKKKSLLPLRPLLSINFEYFANIFFRSAYVLT